MVLLTEPSEFPERIQGIPTNYNFEIQKTLKTIKRLNAKKIALQFPDGLLCYAPLIIDTIEQYTGANCTILDDVVYGACCVDDKTIGCDILIHYGHSCLIPVNEIEVRVLYVFVDIKIDVDHICELIIRNFKGKVAVIGTIQFNSSVNKLKKIINAVQQEQVKVCCVHGENSGFLQTNGENVLKGELVSEIVKLNCNSVKEDLVSETEQPDTGICTCVSAVVPQVKPLSPGEVLGCTSPIINSVENVVYIGDGRFHLESAMIRNPDLNFYKYCPFTRKMTREFYDFLKMKETREKEIKKAMNGKTFGVILGSLGRQGNKQIMKNVIKLLESMNKYKIYQIVMDEINQDLLDNYPFIDSFVQISCPRLSIDWGSSFKKPLLSPFELFYNGEYAMDYYSNEGSAPWKNYNNK